jgi:hypothetical protein
MKKINLFALLAFLPLQLFSQDFGYFGKKNLIGVHGTWFFRAMPQYFHPEKMYRFDEGSNSLKSNSFRNHVWHSGLSYRRILNRTHAVGIQAEYYSRQLGDPIHDKVKKLNYRADWATNGADLSQVYAWSNEIQKAMVFNNLDLTPTSFSVFDFKLIWSRSRTSSVFPLGLTSTWGLGFQQFTLNYDKPFYASAFTYDLDLMIASEQRETFRLNAAPDGFVNNYWGIGWMWDLSLNYALKKNFLLSFGSDIRGTFFVQQASGNSVMQDVFPNAPNGLPVLEGMVHGRNMNREIRKEMIIQNTFRLGLIFAF